MNELLVQVDDVSKKFCGNLRRSLWYGLKDLGCELIGKEAGHHHDLRRDEFWAVKNVSFELRRGDCLGLIGHNGAGKTTLLRMLNGLIKPDDGRIEMHGRVGALIALGAGFHPLLTGRENIFVNATILGFSKQEVVRRFDEIVEFSGLSEHLDAPVQHYSSGMFVRLGFAIAAHLNPDILLVDEALAVGDVEFTLKCLNRIASLRRSGVGVIFVSHNEMQVRNAAQRCLMMSRGELVCDGPVSTAFSRYEQSRTPNTESPDSNFSFDGAITIKDSRLETDQDKLISTGQKLLLRMNFNSKLPAASATFVLRFWNSSGLLVTAIRRELTIPNGRFSLKIKIPELTLIPGHYRLAGGFIQEGEFLCWSRELPKLEISACTATAPPEGQFVLPASFQVEPAPPKTQAGTAEK